MSRFVLSALSMKDLFEKSIMRIRLRFIVGFLLGLFFSSNLCTPGSVASTDEDSRPVYNAFSKINTAKQKEELVRIFSDRIKKSENLFYTLDSTLRFRSYKDGKVGDSIGPFVKGNFSQWIYGDIYRLDIESFTPDRNEPEQWVSVVYDLREGIATGKFEQKNLSNKVFGRIGTEQDPLSANNHYMCWLSDSFCNSDTSQYLSKNTYIFPYLLKHVDEWKIVLLEEERKVKLDVNYLPDFNLKSVRGKRTLILDPEKNFLPLNIESKWEGADENDKKMWREEKVEVEKSKQLGEIWMPVELTTSIYASSVPESLSVMSMKINDIAFGSVTKKDVTLIFPEGAEVVDAIRGISYKTDANGNPIQSTVEALYGLDPSQVKMPGSEPSRRINYIFMILGIGMIIVALYLQFKKRFASA